jgi:hypothetical protein
MGEKWRTVIFFRKDGEYQTYHLYATRREVRKFMKELRSREGYAEAYLV